MAENYRELSCHRVSCRKRRRDGGERVHAPVIDPQSAAHAILNASKGAEDKSDHTFPRKLAVDPATDADAYHLWGRSECSQVSDLAPDMQQLAQNLRQVSTASCRNATLFYALKTEVFLLFD